MTRLVWRRRAPYWLSLTAHVVVALAAAVTIWALLVLVAALPL